MTFDEEYMMIDNMFRKQEQEYMLQEEERMRQRAEEYMNRDEASIYCEPDEAVAQLKVVTPIAVVILIICGVGTLGILGLCMFFYLFGERILYNLLF